MKIIIIILYQNNISISQNLIPSLIKSYFFNIFFVFNILIIIRNNLYTKISQKTLLRFL